MQSAGYETWDVMTSGRQSRVIAWSAYTLYVYARHRKLHTKLIVIMSLHLLAMIVNEYLQWILCRYYYITIKKTEGKSIN